MMDRIIVGAQGVSKIDRKSMAKMTDEGKWELKEFSFNEKTRQVRFLTDDIAIVAYSVNEKLVVEGKPLQLDAHDSSVWIRRDGRVAMRAAHGVACRRSVRTRQGAEEVAQRIGNTKVAESAFRRLGHSSRFAC